MKNNQGLTLIETLIAITVFSVLSAAAASLMLSSINLREGNQRSLKAEQFVKQVLEKHKDYWSVKDNYDSTPDYDFANNFLQDFSENIYLFIDYACLNTDGDLLNGNGETLNCMQSDPPLRRVTVQLLRNDKIVAEQKADIGRPLARKQ